MFGLGRKNKKQILDAALNTVNEGLAEPYVHKRRVALYTDENTYMTLKALCNRRGWTITRGHTILLQEKLKEEYKKAVQNNELTLHPA
jgi:hypothetical protein